MLLKFEILNQQDYVNMNNEKNTFCINIFFNLLKNTYNDK